mgnify:CR=1 FL=1
MTGSCDDQVLREFNDRLKYLRNLDKRKEEIASSITEQGKMTDEIALALAKAETMTEAEDIYRPYKQKRKTRASVAVEKGLKPFADLILEQREDIVVAVEAEKYINIEKGVENVEQAISGAQDIIAEIISDDAGLRKELRTKLGEVGDITCKLLENENSKIYDMYKDYTEKVSKIPSHRILAINRGEKEECLKVNIVVNDEEFTDIIKKQYVKKQNTYRRSCHIPLRRFCCRLYLRTQPRSCNGRLIPSRNGHPRCL